MTGAEASLRTILRPCGGSASQPTRTVGKWSHHPAPTHHHRLLTQGLEGIVSRAPRAEAEASVPEVLLVDTL